MDGGAKWTDGQANRFALGARANTITGSPTRDPLVEFEGASVSIHFTIFAPIEGSRGGRESNGTGGHEKQRE
jgi:hypothetical protein